MMNSYHYNQSYIGRNLLSWFSTAEKSKRWRQTQQYICSRGKEFFKEQVPNPLPTFALDIRRCVGPPCLFCSSGVSVEGPHSDSLQLFGSIGNRNNNFQDSNILSHEEIDRIIGIKDIRFGFQKCLGFLIPSFGIRSLFFVLDKDGSVVHCNGFEIVKDKAVRLSTDNMYSVSELEKFFYRRQMIRFLSGSLFVEYAKEANVEDSLFCSFGDLGSTQDFFWQRSDMKEKLEKISMDEGFKWVQGHNELWNTEILQLDRWVANAEKFSKTYGERRDTDEDYNKIFQGISEEGASLTLLRIEKDFYYGKRRFFDHFRFCDPGGNVMCCRVRDVVFILVCYDPDYSTRFLGIYCSMYDEVARSLISEKIGSPIGDKPNCFMALMDYFNHY